MRTSFMSVAIAQPLGQDYGGSNPNSLGANNFTGRLFRSGAPNQWSSLTHNGTALNSAPHADSRAMAVDLKWQYRRSG